MRIVLLILICGLCGCGGAPKRPKASKGPQRRQVLSPRNGFLVTAQSANPMNNDRELIVTRPSLRDPIIRFPFAREVDIAWAPDESAMAILDGFLPNENRVVIFALPSGQALHEIRRDDICQMNPRLPCGRDYTRIYFSNFVWLSPNTVQVTVQMAGPTRPGLPPEAQGLIVADFQPNSPEPK